MTVGTAPRRAAEPAGRRVPGILALLGGREHTPGCEPIDRLLLEASGAARPVVTVVPYASSLRTRARTVGLAVRWWSDLGVRVVVAPPDGHAAFDAVDGADVLVLTGGVPDRLQLRLARTGLGARIVQRWFGGLPVAGSSSGAMAIAELRQCVRPPFAVRHGLGLLPGVGVAPHHDLRGPQLVAAWRARTHPHAVLLGIDERTAVVTGPDLRTARVLGAGTVTVHRGRWQRRYPAGTSLDVELLPAAAHRTAPPARVRPLPPKAPGPARAIGTVARHRPDPVGGPGHAPVASRNVPAAF